MMSNVSHPWHGHSDWQASTCLPSVFRHSRSWIGIPLILRDQVTGLLSLTHNEPGYYTQTHARLAQAITNQVAVAIENARLYEQAQDLATLEERNRIARELHDSVTQLLYGISLYSTAASRSVQQGQCPSRWKITWPRSRTTPCRPCRKCAC